MKREMECIDFSSCHDIAETISQVVVGKKEAVELVLATLMAEGHILLQDVPGVGKTLLSKSLARSIGGVFKRIQCAPDLLPADVTGFNVYNQKTGQFVYQQGPVIANVLLVDEINRAVPRTQASLLESMEEGQVTIDGSTIRLPRPFFVMATQNPIELEGTFPLPEAQLDRFMMRIHLGYPEREQEMEIMARFQREDRLDTIDTLVSTEAIVDLQQKRRVVGVSEHIRAYIADIVRATRAHAALQLGASPRASLGLMRAGQALAALRGRSYVIPDDIKYLVKPVLAHRLILQVNERLRGTVPEEIVEEIVEKTPVPPETGPR